MPFASSSSASGGCAPSATLLLLALTASTVHAAPPTLNHLYPAGGQRGQTVEVTAGGEFGRWPIQAWVSGKGVSVQPAKDKGKLAITVADDAAPGVYWLRLHDAEGASALRPFIVGGLPERLEKEPNDDFKKSHRLDTTVVTLNGKLEKVGDVDCFALRLRKGQTLVASLEANRRLGSPLDGVLQVLTADGFVLEESNDELGLDPQLAYTATRDGDHVVRLYCFPAVPNSGIRFAGADNFIYRLTLTTEGFADHAFPLALQRSAAGAVELVGWNIPPALKKVAIAATDGDSVIVAQPQVAAAPAISLEPHSAISQAQGNSRQQPQAITLPATISGRLERKGDVHAYQFDAKKGQKLAFQAEARTLDFATDPMLRVVDATGKSLVQAEATKLGLDPELAITVPLDGQYTLEVRDRHNGGGPRHLYRLRAVAAVPSFGLTLAADRFVITPGKPLDIPIVIERKNGFAQEIELSVAGLPAGVTATTVQTGPAAKAKTVTLRLTADGKPASVPIHITGHVKGQSEPGQPARAPIAGLNPANTHVWLSVLGK